MRHVVIGLNERFDSAASSRHRSQPMTRCHSGKNLSTTCSHQSSISSPQVNAIVQSFTRIDDRYGYSGIDSVWVTSNFTTHDQYFKGSSLASKARRRQFNRCVVTRVRTHEQNTRSTMLLVFNDTQTNGSGLPSAAFEDLSLI